MTDVRAWTKLETNAFAIASLARGLSHSLYEYRPKATRSSWNSFFDNMPVSVPELLANMSFAASIIKTSL